ncbi:MAG: sulfite exporter TauE/SafE family protein [Gallionella sp.]
MDYLVGIIIGAVLGLTGAGGSVFAVPLLIYLVHLSPQSAIGVSLGAVCISAIFGVLTKLKSGQIEWLPAIVFSVIGGLFSPLGVYFNQQLNETVLMVGFSGLVFIVAIRLWLQATRTPLQTKTVRSSISEDGADNEALCRANKNAPFKIGLPCISGMAVAGISTGILSGLFGVGGGFIIVPTLLLLTGISIQQAVATSLVVISVVSLTGFVSFITAGSLIDIGLLSHVAIGGVIGMGCGVAVSRYLAGPILQKTFSVLMLVMAVVTVSTSILN